MLSKKVKDVVEASGPLGLCDACIARELGASRDGVRKVTEPFSLTKDFTRYPSNCPRCGRQGMVIRQAIEIHPTG